MIDRRRLVAAAPGLFGLLTLGGQKPVRAASAPPGRQTYFLLAFSDPIAGQEAAYARWFSEPHLHDASALPGFAGVQRYTDAKVELRRAPTKTPQDLILYTFDTDRPDEAREVIARRAEAGEVWPGPSVAEVRTVTYRAIQPRMRGVGGEPADAKPGDPATFLVLAFLDAVAGQDEAFNTWYDTIHEPELLANHGVVSGQRSVLSEVQIAPSKFQSRYMMQMTVVTSDLPAIFHQMLAGGPPPPALDRTRGFGYNYQAVKSQP